MKAKTINETIGFKRYNSAKKALNVGVGIVPEDSYAEFIKEGLKRWADYLTEAMKGKRISFLGSKYDPQGKFAGWDSYRNYEGITVDHFLAESIVKDPDMIDIDGNKYKIAGHKTIKIWD